MVRAVGAADRAVMAAVASRDGERAAAFASEHGIGRWFGSYEALLDSPDVDVVYIALPNHLHARWTIQALDAGKHVLCEKPLALTVDEVDAIIDAAQRAGRVAAEGFMHLHHPQIRRAVELARDGSLGPIELVAGSFSFPLDHPGDPRTVLAMGGGSLWDVGLYPVSIARRVAGAEPSSVAAFARFDDGDVDRSFVGQMRFANGMLAQFDSGFAAPDRQRIEIVGRLATLTLPHPFLSAPDGPDPSLILTRDGAPTVIEVEAVDQVRLEVEDLTAAILDGATPRVTLDFSRGNVATLVALDRAARDRRVGTPE